MNLFADFSIDQLTYMLQKGEISIGEIIKECEESYNVISKSEKGLFYIEKNVEIELKEILNAERDNLELYGIPVCLNAIINTIDYRTKKGISEYWIDAGNDARVVFQIKNKGGWIIGKYDDYSFRGANAVLFGFTPIVIDMQINGSITKTCEQFGVYGYVPSYGVIPRTGIFTISNTVDSVGFITSRIDNIRKVFDSIIVKGMDYPFIHKAFSDDNRQMRGKRKWKICFYNMNTGGFEGNNEKEYFLDFFKSIKNDTEIDIYELDFSDIVSRATKINGILYETDKLYDQESNVSDELMDKNRYFHALDEQAKICKEIDDLMKDYDVMLSTDFGLQENKLCEMGRVFSLCHLPNAYIPIAYEEAMDLSVGIFLSARRFNDGILMGFIEYLASNSIVPTKIRRMYI